MSWDIIISCTLNSWLGGNPEETLCSRAWRNALFYRKWVYIQWTLDLIHRWKEHEHCWQSHLRFLRGRARKRSLCFWIRVRPFLKAALEWSSPAERLAMSLQEIVADTARVLSCESTNPTQCGQCNKPLPLSFTDRRFKIEGALMRLSFCSWWCVTRYERARR